MRLHFVWIGKTKDRRCAALVDDYLERLSRFATYEISELKEAAGVTDEKRAVFLESTKLLTAIERDDFVVLLDERGQQFSSTELADFVATRQQHGTKRLALVIGGFAGVSEEVKKRAQLKVALSRLTFTHELARVLLAEQIYRAYTLLAGLPYHKF
ncbi:MAG TPA: 23S rRNA (pseudouridine(1915)-N(3))-methyltransferase RlmH [Blastocatellia bacterium]|nr:23S rRNA (pseudouridine(1915)-N(3))-methyltransferase RlmH [Blastocatellia bacterium]